MGEPDSRLLFTRRGTVVDIPSTTSALGLAYGGAANLSAVITTGDPEDASQAGKSN